MSIERFNEALDRNTETYEFSKRLHAEVKRTIPNPHQLEGVRREHAADLYQTVYNIVRATTSGNVFYLDPEIASAVRSAANDLPESVSLHRDMLPCDTGFLWCCDPLPIPPDVSEQGVQVQYHGWTWADVHYAKSDREECRFTGVGLLNNRALTAGTLHWEFGKSIGDFQFLEDETRKFTESDEAQLRFLAALLLFMQQRILVETKRLPSRSSSHRARRVTHDTGAEPSVKVIQLRARDYVPSKEDGSVLIERSYSVQWLVRGHWRNQWYPSLGRHQPKWIAPYVKGPDDAPLKEPKANLFTIVR